MLVLVAELERVLALDPGEVDLGIEQRRILPLRIGALAAEGSEAGDADGGQTAGDDGVGGQAGDGDGVVADGEGVLAGLGAGEAEAGIEDLVGAEAGACSRARSADRGCGWCRWSGRRAAAEARDS